MLLDKENAHNLDPATTAEIEWAFERAHSGYTNDFIRRGIIAAEDETEALSFVGHKQKGGGCGPSGGPNDVAYWYECHADGFHAWFGPKIGNAGAPEFKPGTRYVKLTWQSVVRRVREQATGPKLF